MSSTEEKKGNKAIVWIIINVVQLVAIGALVFMLMNKNQEIESLNSNLSNTETNLENTSKELFEVRDRLIATKKKYHALGIEKEGLDEKIAELDGYVAKLKGDLNMSKAERNKLKKFISDLEADLLEKDKEIKRLSEENENLITQVDTLNTANKELGQELEMVTIGKQELNDFIEAASVLSVDEMKISALKASGKEFEKEEYRAKSIDRLKIRFSLADNKAAQKDSKKFLIQLVLPSGEIFSDKNNGGGVSQLRNGTDIKYTMSKNLKFDNSGQELTFLMLKGFNYVSGNYIVNVACEGEMIGSGFFNVK